MIKMIRTIILMYMLYCTFFVSLGYARSTEYGKQVITHVVSEDCRKNKKCINSILESELKYSTQVFFLGIIDTFEDLLPDILNNIKLDIEKDLKVKL